jgi:predicted short-subunit dehydrogenase-like oxidoreductase (DUF2520 family)
MQVEPMKKTKAPSLTFVLIGSGNVATQMGLELIQHKQQVIQVYSRIPAHADKLASVLGSSHTSSIKEIRKDADVYIVAVKDDSISQLAKTLRLIDKPVFHTSGSVSMNALKPISSRYGVIYPLQSLSRNSKPNWNEIPVCIEANSKQGLVLLYQIGKSMGWQMTELNSKKRSQLHLAAVFASNFSNHMYVLAIDLLKKYKLPVDLLNALILETARKAVQSGPHKAQTGPAVRKDKKTLWKHIDLLSSDKKYLSLYKSISQSIQKK